MTLGLTFGLMAGGSISPVVPVEVTTTDFTPYFGGGVGYTVDAEKFYGVLLAGVEYGENIGIEGRYSSKFTGEGDTAGIYLKPRYVFTNGVGVYGLLGWEYTYNLPETFCAYRRCSTRQVCNTSKGKNIDSWAVGGGVEYKNFFVDGIYNDKLNDTKVVVGYRYRF